MKKMLVASLLMLALGATGTAAVNHHPAKKPDVSTAVARQQSKHETAGMMTQSKGQKSSSGTVRSKSVAPGKSGANQGSAVAGVKRKGSGYRAALHGGMNSRSRSHKHVAKMTRGTSSRVDSSRMK